MRRSSEPVLERSGQGCKMSVLMIAVGRQAGRDCALGSARMPASSSVAAATELVEVASAEGGGETQVVVLPNAPQQLHLAAPFCREGEGAGRESGGDGWGDGGLASGDSGRIRGAQSGDFTAALAT
jgi:hypothetical protein